MDVLGWLMEGDAAIRWQVKRDLLADAAGGAADQRLVATTGWGRRLLDLQDPEGTWAQALYSPKWTSTTYTLLLLKRLGLEAGHPAARRGCEVLLESAWRDADGGLTLAKTVLVPETCITAMLVGLDAWTGLGHPVAAAAADWLMGQQLPDGGWNCDHPRTGSVHGSFHTSIIVLEALAELDGRTGNAQERGREFFLGHRLYRSHRTGEVVDRSFTRFSFPPRWHFDVLRALDHFASTAAPTDDRFEDAVRLVDERKRSDGRWPIERSHPGRVWFPLEQGPGPSRWNTLRALRVMRWWGRQADAI